MAEEHGALLETAIVGAGIAGIGMAARLKRAGRTRVVLLERADEVGGTWRDNVYPGVACDIPSHLYEFSFRPKTDWSRVFAPGAEIQGYLRETVAAEGITPWLRTGAGLEHAEWVDGDDGTTETTDTAGAGFWRIRTPAGTLRARSLVLAAGRLTEPRIPAVPGLDGFTGRAFHSARWPRGLGAGALAGLRVGVVGTGASAVQLIPHVAAEAASLVVFQRTPAWVLPRGDRGYAPGEPRPDRTELAAEAERLFAARIAGSEASVALHDRALAHLAAQLPDAGLRAALTPDYAIGCKRAVFSDDFYPSLQRPQVALEPSALASVDESVTVAASGARHELDVLIFATGFETARPPYAPLVTGRGGRTLAQHWERGMVSHASTVVHGFPNLFVLDGPNAALGHHSAVEVIEAQHDYVLGALGWLAERPDASLEVPASAEAAYAELIDTLAARTVWTQGGCTSWYRDPVSGRLTLLWPERVSEFRRRNGSFDPAVFIAAPVPAAGG